MMGSPGAPGANGSGNGNAARGGSRFPRAAAPSNTGRLLLRSHSGYGEFATLDPSTGDLSSAPHGMGNMAGVYDQIDGVRVLFYRDRQLGLVLRIEDMVLHVDRLGADAYWERNGQGLHRLLVSVAGTPQCELRYRALPADADLGLLIRDVLSDPVRRGSIFG